MLSNPLLAEVNLDTEMKNLIARNFFEESRFIQVLEVEIIGIVSSLNVKGNEEQMLLRSHIDAYRKRLLEMAKADKSLGGVIIYQANDDPHGTVRTVSFNMDGSVRDRSLQFDLKSLKAIVIKPVEGPRIFR